MRPPCYGDKGQIDSKDWAGVGSYQDLAEEFPPQLPIVSGVGAPPPEDKLRNHGASDVYKAEKGWDFPSCLGMVIHVLSRYGK